MFVVGTAGHIDHGKSSLVLKMTGIDPDRLPEEKERGMTIDLGFAWAELPSGRQIGIVDVPGHERFIKNMVAGVGGIDAVIFVIAADDGWMPQSEEHFQIIQLLGIKTGLVALTKKDLVEEDFLQLQVEAIQERLRGSFLDGCPIMPVSNATGDGVVQILESLDKLLTDNMQRPDIGAARLFIDRRFIIQGMGTVVTGTLLEGKLIIDQQVEIQPSGITTRVRTLQTHKHLIKEATPGSRVAINLAGVGKSAIDRGEAICLPGSVKPSEFIAGEIELLSSAKFVLKSGAEVSFLLGTADILARVYPLDSDSIKPGTRGLVTIRLKAPVAAKLGDRFIIRRISPQDTVGGGRVLDTEFVGGRKNKGQQLELLKKRFELTPESIVLTELDKNIEAPTSKLYCNIPFEKRMMESALKLLSEKNEILISGENILSVRFLEQFAKPAMEIFESEHELRQWSDGVDPGLLAKKLKLDPEQLPTVIDYLVSTGKIMSEKGLLRLASHRAELNANQLRLHGRLIARLSASPLAAPTKKDFIDEDPSFEVVINFLRDKGEIIECKGGILLTRHDFEDISQRLIEYLKRTHQATASDIKAYLRTSRKYIIPILEKFDQLEITIRDGDYRRLTK
jgi:selenocysteine-specific elongation factor